MSTRAFVEVAREAAGSHRSRVPPLFVEWNVGAERPWVWPFYYVTSDSCVRQRLSESVYVALIYTDGSAQLLSRDEDECLLFATQWELGR